MIVTDKLVFGFDLVIPSLGGQMILPTDQYRRALVQYIEASTARHVQIGRLRVSLF